MVTELAAPHGDPARVPIGAVGPVRVVVGEQGAFEGRLVLGGVLVEHDDVGAEVVERRRDVVDAVVAVEEVDGGNTQADGPGDRVGLFVGEGEREQRGRGSRDRSPRRRWRGTAGDATWRSARWGPGASARYGRERLDDGDARARPSIRLPGSARGRRRGDDRPADQFEETVERPARAACRHRSRVRPRRDPAVDVRARGG